jgi:hypothetical protein
MRLALHGPVLIPPFDTGRIGRAWRDCKPGLRSAAIIGASVLAAPVTLAWLAYGAWLTARDIDRDGTV